MLSIVVLSTIIGHIEAISVCKPVDSLFIINSCVIGSVENKHNENFFNKLIYDSDSEIYNIGTIGIIIYGQLLNKLNYTKIDDFVLLNLKDTINIIDTNKLKAVFIVNEDINSNDQQLCVNYALDIYYIEINEYLKIEYIYDCKKQKEISNYDELNDLYEIIYSLLFDTQCGELKLNKKYQLIEYGSIISCNLIQIEISESGEMELLDNMSYEINYVLIIIQEIFITLPIYKIKKIKLIILINNDKPLLELNVVSINIFEYIMSTDINIEDNSENDNDIFVHGNAQYNQNEIHRQRRRRRRIRRLLNIVSWVVENIVDSVINVAGGVINAAGVFVDDVGNTFQNGFYQIVDGINRGIDTAYNLLNGSAIETLIKEILSKANGNLIISHYFSITRELEQKFESRSGLKITGNGEAIFIEILIGIDLGGLWVCHSPIFSFKELTSNTQFSVEELEFSVYGNINIYYGLFLFYDNNANIIFILMYITLFTLLFVLK